LWDILAADHCFSRQNPARAGIFRIRKSAETFDKKVPVFRADRFIACNAQQCILSKHQSSSRSNGEPLLNISGGRFLALSARIKVCCVNRIDRAPFVPFFFGIQLARRLETLRRAVRPWRQDVQH
jgi:hypothetical protein